ncbi:MAG: glutamine amidotransferase [Devosia sp.]
MARDAVRVLLVGETVYKIHTHFKGFASYETGYASLSLEVFTSRFEGREVDITFMPNHEVSLRFPSTLEAMQAFDVIVISDAPADSFLLHPDTLAGKIYPDRLRLIGDYVRAGGGFLMVGGWMAYGGFHGKAHYAYSPLARFLPVKIATHDDRMETPEGVFPKPVADHPILAGLPAEWPDFLGYNKVEQKGGTLLLEFRETGDPLLIVDDLGQGRLACFTSDLLPHWGSPRFTAWDAYVDFWEQMFRWLGGK